MQLSKIIKGVFVLLFICFQINVVAQQTNTLNYQAVIRDADNMIKQNVAVTIEFSILEGSNVGSVIFSETHNLTTNNLGLITAAIGSLNNGVSKLEDVNFSSTSYYLQITLDGEVMGTSLIQNVPLAIHAKVADSATNFDYNNLSNLPDFSNYDKDTSDDFSGNYEDLTNKPVTITQEQSDKIDSISLTKKIDLDSLANAVAVNNAKIGFPGFGTTEGTVLEGNTPLWQYSNGNLYHNGKVGINVAENNTSIIPVLRVGGGVLFEGKPTSSNYPGTLFYSAQGDGSFRYYNNNNQEVALGSGNITQVVNGVNAWEQDSCVSLNETLLVDGSLGVGMDIVNGEDFGFTTFKIKENNVRILFDDADSSDTGYPYHDWLLEANESANGGTNHFAINNETMRNTPFKIMASADDNTLYLDDKGVGIGTNVVDEKLTVNGNVKAEYFIGDGSGLTGITNATGGVANIDTTVISADTNGNGVGMIALQIANDNKMVVLNNGNVGIGTSIPTEKLEVNGNAKFNSLEVSGIIDLSNYSYEILSDTITINNDLQVDVLNKSVITYAANTAGITIKGFENGVIGQEIIVINTGVGDIVFTHNGTSSQIIKAPSNNNITITTNGSAKFIFDGNFWYCIAKN